jgi:hypothetical protein
MNTELPKVVYREFKQKEPLLMTLLYLINQYLDYLSWIHQGMIEKDEVWVDQAKTRIHLLRKQYDEGIKYDDNPPLEPFQPKFL